MSQEPHQRTEQARSALATLSVVGAALAGAAVGVLLALPLRSIAWPLLAIGLIAHLFAMVGTRRLLAAGGYNPPWWQRAGYWLCWVAIAAIAIIAAMRLA